MLLKIIMILMAGVFIILVGWILLRYRMSTSVQSPNQGDVKPGFWSRTIFASDNFFRTVEEAKKLRHETVKEEFVNTKAEELHPEQHISKFDGKSEGREHGSMSTQKKYRIKENM